MGKSKAKGGRGGSARATPTVSSVKLSPEADAAVDRILEERRRATRDPFLPRSAVIRDLVVEALVLQGQLK